MTNCCSACGGPAFIGGYYPALWLKSVATPEELKLLLKAAKRLRKKSPELIEAIKEVERNLAAAEERKEEE